MTRTLKAGNSGYILLRTLIALAALTLCLAAMLAAAAGAIRHGARVRETVRTEIDRRNADSAGDGGFTLLESVVAASLMLTFLALSGAVLYTAWRGMETSALSGQAAFIELRVDDELRRIVFDAPLSYWDGEYGVSRKALHALERTITETEGSLYGAVLIDAAVYDADGTGSGLAARYVIDGEEYLCRAPFGTVVPRAVK